MKTWEIWVEGWQGSGDGGVARKLGEMDAHDFKEACVKWMLLNPDYAKHYNLTNNSYWCCRLFPTRHQAQRSFG